MQPPSGRQDGDYWPSQETDDHPLSRREAGDVVGMAGQDQGQRLFARGLEEGGGRLTSAV